MKLLSEQDHYEILEISRVADAQEIERAYRLARGTYTGDSLAGYSLFAEGDAQAVLERIEVAYRVLSDPAMRRAYDAGLEGGVPPRPAAAAEMRSEPRPAVEDLEELDDDAGGFDGPRLRRSRLRRGLELKDVSGVTKVNPTYLRFLEEERFSDLPAPVYVRGFVTAYAQCLGLDARRVAVDYMRRYEAGSESRGRKAR